MYVQVIGCVSRAQRARPAPMRNVPAWKAQDWREIMAAEKARENARRVAYGQSAVAAVAPVYSAPAMRLAAIMGAV